MSSRRKPNAVMSHDGSEAHRAIVVERNRAEATEWDRYWTDSAEQRDASAGRSQRERAAKVSVAGGLKSRKYNERDFKKWGALDATLDPNLSKVRRAEIIAARLAMPISSCRTIRQHIGERRKK